MLRHVGFRAAGFAGVEQVLVIGGKLDREALVLVDPALGAIELPERRHAAIRLLVLLDRGVLVAQRIRVLSAFDDVVGVDGPGGWSLSDRDKRNSGRLQKLEPPAVLYPDRALLLRKFWRV